MSTNPFIPLSGKIKYTEGELYEEGTIGKKIKDIDESLYELDSKVNDSKPSIYYQSSEPESPKEGDIWINPDEGSAFSANNIGYDSLETYSVNTVGYALQSIYEELSGVEDLIGDGGLE